MPQPTPSQVHVSRPLTNVSTAYIQRHDAYIASQVFPRVPVTKDKDQYYTYDKDDWFRDEAEIRAPSTESAGSGYGLSTATYACKPIAFHKDVPREVIINADGGIQPMRDATEFVTQRLLLKQEMDWAAAYFVTGVWGTSSTPGDLWDDYTASDPIGNIRTGRRTILANTGLPANTLVLSYDVFTVLQDHPQLVDRIKYTSSNTITTEMMARMFDVDRVLVCQAVKATNVEGETAAFDFVQGKHALLCHSASSPGLLTPTAGYSFVWTGVSAGMGAQVGISQWYEQKIKSWRVEGEVAYDMKLIASDLGYMFVSVVS